MTFIQAQIANKNIERHDGISESGLLVISKRTVFPKTFSRSIASQSNNWKTLSPSFPIWPAHESNILLAMFCASHRIKLYHMTSNILF